MGDQLEWVVKIKSLIVKKKLLKELEDYFQEDEKRINHAQDVLQFSEKLLEKENGDWEIVVPASILHDVGIKVAEKKYGSNEGHYQEKEGPEIARGCLNKIGYQQDYIDEICNIIAHHHSPGIINTNNFKILYDADSLVNIKEIIHEKNIEERTELINKIFLTDSGKKMAQDLYL